MTMEELVKSRGASSEAAAFLADTIWFGYGWPEVSALHRLLSDVALYHRGQTVHAIEGGNDRLPKAFANALRERIFYGAPVLQISQDAGDAGKVRAVFLQGGSQQTLEADRLICTVPCPLLRRIEVSPALPERKRRILDGLEYLPVTRIFMQSRRRFWLDQGEAGGAFTDLPIVQLSEQPVVKLAERGPRGVLEAHVRGPQAQRASDMAPDARLAFALENVEKIHPGFRSHYEGGTSVSWGADPWARGGYAWWKPGQLTEWVPELARAEGRIHFAGEHTSWLGRTLEGALESGNRAAREVNEAG
jgi:monoamine oxidase